MKKNYYKMINLNKIFCKKYRKWICRFQVFDKWNGKLEFRIKNGHVLILGISKLRKVF